VEILIMRDSFQSLSNERSNNNLTLKQAVFNPDR
jgi:hypothetical protein